MLTRAISLIGPPAVGKSALALRLGMEPGYTVFRLREHVPQAVLAATATDAERLGWIDDFTVMTSVHGYLEVARDRAVHSVLLDNFPGTETQVSLYLSLMRQLAPDCAVAAVELTAQEFVLRQRSSARRVCGYCERDPLCDPRLPAAASASDPRRCARCDHLLVVRHGDDPTVYHVRMRRYYELSNGVRQAFAHAGIPVPLLLNSSSLDRTAKQLTALFTPRSRHDNCPAAHPRASPQPRRLRLRPDAQGRGRPRAGTHRAGGVRAVPARKRMSVDRFRELRGQLDEWGVF